jgi:transitional endoplasmic reticulum ATPase
MDDATLRSLLGALEASPDNLELRTVLVRARLERGETAAAYELVEPLRRADRKRLPEATRRAAARAALDSGHGEEALEWAEGQEPETALLRARVMLALKRQREGLDLYQDAVRRNPALEDRDLRRQLGARVHQFPVGDAQRRLTVLSNDDTDDTETVRLLEPKSRRVTFEDVGGLAGVKKEITRRILLPFQKPSLFQRFRKRVGGGILLYGPPGCGKTLLARATAGEAEASFWNVAISDVLDMYIGESERKLHALFEKARADAPSVMFFDELEALGGKRQYTREGVSSKLVSQFLSEMDGFTQNNSGVLVLAATNVPWAIDPAFRRPGRFDRVLFVPPPDREAREAILRLLLAGRPTGEDVDVAAVARKTTGLSGADLENLVETAADEAIEASIAQEREVPMDQGHLLYALESVRPSTTEWLTTARNYARYANEGGQYDEVLEFLRQHAKA